ncbi:MAG: D-glycero-beta-D-manno-heptose 1-phosphate adenylyltransferase [Halanaerobiaceae bacterium]
MNKMIKSLDNLKNIIINHKKDNKKIVLTNGCFDILHIGHIRYLYQAAALGDVLLVGVNSDASIKTIKNENRPIIEEKERAEIVAALEMVDYVTIFDETTCSNLLKEIKPDIYVKGGDYTPENLPEWSVTQKYRIKVKFIKLVENKSTTKIIKKIREN